MCYILCVCIYIKKKKNRFIENKTVRRRSPDDQMAGRRDVVIKFVQFITNHSSYTTSRCRIIALYVILVLIIVTDRVKINDFSRALMPIHTSYRRRRFLFFFSNPYKTLIFVERNGFGKNVFYL